MTFPPALSPLSSENAARLLDRSTVIAAARGGLILAKDSNDDPACGNSRPVQSESKINYFFSVFCSPTAPASQLTAADELVLHCSFL